MKSSATLNDTVVIPIRVNPVNDAPQIVLPRSQTVLISGYQVKDVDLKGNMQVNISVASSAGYITLVESHGINFLSSSTGLYERKISFEGNITSVNAALKTLEYTRYPAFDGGDTLIFSFGNDKQNMVDTTLVELTINNNAKNTEHNPVILRISPSRVPVDGGSLIFVFGSNFNRLDQLFCQFGRDATVPAKVVSDKSLECITPALKHGSILLRVTNKRDLWTNSVEVAIDGRVRLVSLLPKRGSTRGGTDIIVEGENFPDSDVARCKFGLNAIVPALWLSINSIKCTSPPRDMPGKTSVQFSSNGIDFSPQALVYTYDKEVVLNHLTPTRGPIVGGTVVTIYGENFRLDSTLMCRFGVENARASYINSTTVRCTTPRI